jgi:hypothetical protein
MYIFSFFMRFENVSELCSYGIFVRYIHASVIDYQPTKLRLNHCFVEDMEIVYQQPHIDREIESLKERIHPPRYYTKFVIFLVQYLSSSSLLPKKDMHYLIVSSAGVHAMD